MRWCKKDIWKAGIALAGMLLLLVLMIWVPVSAAGAYEGPSGLAPTVMGTVQTTPTEDATVTTLNKEKLQQEVKQLQEQNDATVAALNKQKLERDNDRSFQAWFWSSGTTLLSTLALVIGGFIGFWRWRVDRRETQDKDRVARQDAQDKELAERLAEREKRAEERFQAAVTGLGDEEKEGARIGAAILLRTFLRSGYEQFYTQTFDLAVAHLRLRGTSHPSEDPDGILHSPEDPNAPLPLTTLRQALIVVFKEAFPLARSQNKGGPQSLDATYIQLDNAYLAGADLKQAWMPTASLRKADLSEADLSGANLSGARLSEAYLYKADLFGARLSGADLFGANLIGANLIGVGLGNAKLSHANLNEAKLSKAYLYKANLSGATLSDVNLSGATLMEANLSGVTLFGANLSGARLSGANLSWATLTATSLSGADLSGADLSGATLMGVDLSGANLRRADLFGVDLRGTTLSGVDLYDFLSLKDTDLRGVKGRTKEQLEALKNEKGAIIDEDSTTSSSQSSAAPPPPAQSNDAQAPSAGPAQESTQTPGTERNSTTSSQLSPDVQISLALPDQVNTPPPDAGRSGATSPQQGPKS